MPLTWPYPPLGQDPASPTSRQAPGLPPRKPALVSRIASLTTRSRHQIKGNNNPAACRSRTLTEGQIIPWEQAGLWLCPLPGQHKLQDISDSITKSRNQPAHPYHQLPEASSGIPGPIIGLQELALPTSRPALTTGSGFNNQWPSNSPGVFGTWFLPPVSQH